MKVGAEDVGRESERREKRSEREIDNVRVRMR